MSDERRALDLCGQLIGQVRDMAISHIDALLRGEMSFESKTGKGLPELFTDDARVAAFELAPVIVDATIHYLLWQMESSVDVSLVATVDGKFFNIGEASDGLTGEPYGSQGWIARFSEQRAT